MPKKVHLILGLYNTTLTCSFFSAAYQNSKGTCLLYKIQPITLSSIYSTHSGLLNQMSNNTQNSVNILKFRSLTMSIYQSCFCFTFNQQKSFPDITMHLTLPTENHHSRRPFFQSIMNSTLGLAKNKNKIKKLYKYYITN